MGCGSAGSEEVRGGGRGCGDCGDCGECGDCWELFSVFADLVHDVSSCDNSFLFVCSFREVFSLSSLFFHVVCVCVCVCLLLQARTMGGYNIPRNESE